jgi:hypothetical protein
MMSKEIEDLKKQIMWLQNQNASLFNRQEALRDHFASLAMQGVVVSRPTWEDTRRIALTSYEMADAMLAERSKRDV